MADDPAYRGTMTRTIVQMVDADTDLLHTVQKVIDAPALQRMRISKSLAWLPAEPLDRLKQIHYDHAGQDAYVAFWRRYMTGIAENPLFRRLLEGGKRIFGNDPAGLLKWMPKGWALSTRGCGTFTVELGERRATLVLDGAPASTRQSSTGQTSRATILGVFDLLDVEGKVEVDDTRMNDGHFEMHARWG